MYAITGITGKVGGALAEALLARGQPVRAILRDADKGHDWAERGCEVALATMQDATSLSAAFEGADGVFILPPPEFDPSPGFPEAHAVIDAVKLALEQTLPSRVVCLSTVGAQASQPNLLTQRTLMEQALGTLPVPITFLRPAWFMDNVAWDVAPARDSGLIHSFLQPLDRAIPMVSAADVGRIACELIQKTWTGRRIVELEGPARVSPSDIAKSLSKALGRQVQAIAVPRAEWPGLFHSQGTRDPTPRIQMLDGFNEGWLDFEGPAETIVKGQVTLDAVVQSLSRPLSA
jgi:NAD(P)H dehydrogenase (quinone)